MVAPSLSPPVSCFSVCQLQPASWYWWHPCQSCPDPHQDMVPCGSEKLLTKLPRVNGGCYSLCSSWCMREIWCMELSVCVFRPRSKAETGFCVVPKGWDSQVPVLHSLPPACPPLPSPNTAAPWHDVSRFQPDGLQGTEALEVCLPWSLQHTGKS